MSPESHDHSRMSPRLRLLPRRSIWRGRKTIQAKRKSFDEFSTELINSTPKRGTSSLPIQYSADEKELSSPREEASRVLSPLPMSSKPIKKKKLRCKYEHRIRIMNKDASLISIPVLFGFNYTYITLRVHGERRWLS